MISKWGEKQDTYQETLNKAQFIHKNDLFGKIGTPAAKLANDIPNPIAAKVPNTFTTSTTIAILHFLDKFVFCCI